MEKKEILLNEEILVASKTENEPFYYEYGVAKLCPQDDDDNHSKFGRNKDVYRDYYLHCSFGDGLMCEHLEPIAWAPLPNTPSDDLDDRLDDMFT